MTPILAWLLKSIICSGILYLYYLLFLKDKVFNRYNRFYLMASVILSLTLPFLHFSVPQDNYMANDSFQILNTVIASGGEDFNELKTASDANMISSAMVGYLLYSIPLLILLLGFTFSLHSIHALYLNNIKSKIEDVTIVTTDDAPGTPFTFLHLLFWNKNISLTSDNGKKILSHELVHIQQKHSYDQIFLQLIQCLFWINPFVWIIKRELTIIHEFLSDEQAVAPGDTAAFAEMMLQTAYTNQHFSIANHLSFSSIKRRINMIKKNKNPKMNYLSRIVAIPVIALLVGVSSAYVSKNKINAESNLTTYDNVISNLLQQKSSVNIDKALNNTSTPNNIELRSEDPIVILLDAGHGGSDAGAFSSIAKVKEKDLTLAIVKRIVALNTDPKIKFILTRQADETILVKNRTANLTDSIDLVISIHVDNGPFKGQNEKSGVQIFVSRDEFKNSTQSKIFGSAITSAFSKNYELPVGNSIQQRQMGVWILQALEVPSIIIETGYMNNPKDMAFLTTEKGITSIANNILNGIKTYANATNLVPSKNLKGNSVTLSGTEKELHLKNLTYTNEKNDIKFEIAGEVLVTDDDNLKITGISKFSNSGKLPLEHIYLDGVKVNESEFNKLPVNNIVSISVLKGNAAIAVYGEAAKEGAMVITTKANAATLYVIDGRVVTKTAFTNLVPNDIKTINVIQEEEALKLYGEQGKSGAIQVITKERK